MVPDNLEHQVNPRCRARATGDLARFGKKLLCDIYVRKLFLKARNIRPMSRGFAVVQQPSPCQQIGPLLNRVNFHAQAGLNPYP